MSHDVPISFSIVSLPNNVCWGFQIIKLLIAGFSSLLSLYPSQAQVASSAPFSWTPSAYILFLNRQIGFTENNLRKSTPFVSCDFIFTCLKSGLPVPPSTWMKFADCTSQTYVLNRLLHILQWTRRCVHTYADICACAYIGLYVHTVSHSTVLSVVSCVIISSVQQQWIAESAFEKYCFRALKYDLVSRRS